MIPIVPGLTYVPDFILPNDEQALIAFVDGRTWLTDLKRRVQHYGYKYDYKARAVTSESALGSLPDQLQKLAIRLAQEEIFPEPPDQVIVNEYQPGQGISAHIDCVPCFTETIVSLSLLSGCSMTLKAAKTGVTRVQYLRPRSLLVLKGESRYEWQHAIAARKSDMVDGGREPRSRRLSLTFRKVIL